MGLRGPKPKPFECQEKLFWYLVGLIATDGCLLKDGKTVVVTSKEKDFLCRLQAELGACGYIREKLSGYGTIGYDLIFKRKALYDRLAAIGLTPRKSLTLGPLAVPDAFFHETLRGVIDGDGNIRSWRHPTNEREQWTARVYGCSEPFLVWLRDTVERLWHVRGGLHRKVFDDGVHHTRYTLKYGKLAAKVLLGQCYYSGAFALERKRTLAAACIGGSVGWAKSKTVLDRTSWKGWKYEHMWKDRVVGLTNPNVDPTSGLVKEPDGVWAGVLEWQTIKA